MEHRIREELPWVLIFIAMLWGVHFVDFILPPIDLKAYGLRPRSIGGLIGIPLMPFLHGSWGHLISNTIPLAILLLLLAGSRANSMMIVIGLVLGGGSLLWLFGRSNTHVGASGLVYGLIAYLVASGFLERRVVPLLVAILVLFLYGGTMLGGVLPSMDSHISWEGHLMGAIAGGLIALTLVKA